MSAFCAMVGMGAGSVVGPYLRHRGLDLRPAVATASTLNLCISFGGSAAVVLTVSSGVAPAGVQYVPALAMGLAAVVAAPIGVTLAHVLSARRLMSLIGAVNVFTAGTLMLQLVAGR